MMTSYAVSVKNTLVCNKIDYFCIATQEKHSRQFLASVEPLLSVNYGTFSRSSFAFDEQKLVVPLNGYRRNH